jgi:ATP-dependent Lhr-like helicase
MTTTAGGSQRISTAFNLLDPAVQRWIWDKRWPALRPAQEEAVEPILAGQLDIIISAATAAGKTEAAFLPICTALQQAPAAAQHTTTGHTSHPVDGEGQAAPAPGVRVLYVSPLKALINDQWGRLDALCEHLDIPVHRWHGDVGATRKKTVLARPDGILLITPESLEALFVNRGTTIPTLFAGLRYVVIDEMHAFLGTPRGTQLQSLLHRVELAIRRRVPRIGLSATIADEAQAKHYLRAAHPDAVRVITENGESSELRLQVRGYLQATAKIKDAPSVQSAAGPGSGGTPVGLPRQEAHDLEQDAAEGDEVAEGEEPDDQDVFEISTHLFRTLRGTSNLVFANSRRVVEQYADRLSRMCGEACVPNEFLPHHGSLSRDLREDLEGRLRDGSRPTTAICTSTLELGIDIGAVASVAQVGAPPSVAALRQRLGRSGRREGEVATLRMYVTEPEITPKTHPVDTIRAELVQTVAMVDLLLDGVYEPLDEGDLHLSTLIQQVLSMTAQHGGIHPADAYRALCSAGPFRPVEQAMFAQLLRDMGARQLLTQASDGLLLPGAVGERLVNHYTFYAAFRSPEEYRLVADGRTLGTLPVSRPLEPGNRLIFGGRRWRIVAIDDRQKVIELTRSKGGKPPTFDGNGAAVSDEVRQRMLARYHSKDVPVYLDATSQRLLDEGRDYFRRWSLDTQPALVSGSETLIFPWRGDRIHATIAVILTRSGLTADATGVAITITDAGIEKVVECIDRVLSDEPPSAIDLAVAVKNKIIDKYDEYLGEDLINAAYAARSLDVVGAFAALTAVRATS